MRENQGHKLTRQATREADRWLNSVYKVSEWRAAMMKTGSPTIAPPPSMASSDHDGELTLGELIEKHEKVS